METLEPTLFKTICLLYEEFYRQVSLNKSFIYNPNRNDTVLIERFTIWLKQNYHQSQTGEHFLIQYFRFQFSRYAGVTTPHGRNNIMIAWILGDKAREQWLERDPKKQWLVRYIINKNLQLQLENVFIVQRKVKVNKIHKAIILEVHNYEEAEKKKYLNTLEGFIYCSQMTTMYNPKSEVCTICIYKSNCDERLKLNYREIYDLRHDGRLTT